MLWWVHVPDRVVSLLQKRHLEKSEGELSSSFEQRMQVMLHRIGVTKGPAAESKKQQVGTSSIFGMDPNPLQGVNSYTLHDVCQSVSPFLACTHSLHPSEPGSSTLPSAPIASVGTASLTPPLPLFPPCRAKTARSRKPAQMVRDCILPTLTPTQLGTHGWPWAGPLGLPDVGPTTSSPCGVLVAMGRPQLTDAGRWLVLAGDIVDSSADSPPSLKARTHSVSTGGSAVNTGGSHQPLGQRALSPLLALSIGTGANRDWWAQACGQNSTLEMVPSTHGCPSLVMADGRPVPGLAASWFPAPRTIPGAVPSGRPQLHPACPTDAPFRSPAARTEPSAEPRPAWKALGRQLPAEPPATSSDQPRRSFTLAEPSGLPEPGGREGWSSSLPRLGRNVPVALPRRVSHGGEVGAGTLPTPPNTEGRDE